MNKSILKQIKSTLLELWSNKIIRRTSLGLAIVVSFWLFCFHWTGVHEVGIRRNIFTGEVSLDSISGFEVTPPWVQVAMIDTRPQRLCIECDCRSLSCKLIEFNPDGWSDFVAKEGFRYYWWANRFSFNSGADEEYRAMRWILRGYAFSGQEYSFINTTKE